MRDLTGTVEGEWVSYEGKESEWVHVPSFTFIQLSVSTPQVRKVQGRDPTSTLPLLSSISSPPPTSTSTPSASHAFLALASPVRPTSIPNAEHSGGGMSTKHEDSQQRGIMAYQY
jgi:hypothetical protein